MNVLSNKLAWFLLGFTLFFLGIGAVGLVGPDEPRYADVARGMLQSGDYITPRLVSSTQFIGNVVYDNVGVANNLPLAAAFATVPIVIMVIYLLIARRLGAFEHL